MKTFEELGVSEEIRRAITELGFVSPMPVQEEVIPYLLGNNNVLIEREQNEAGFDSAERENRRTKFNDIIALAQTGTGKTAAFGIPVLQRIDANQRETQALVLSPTRELCLQIADDLKDFSKYMPGIHVVAVYGGASIENQIRSLRHGAQVIVATPGRLIDLMNRGVAKLDNVYNVVLDEADEMLNMGFSDSINEIFEGMPADRNTLLFSATMSREIEAIAKNYLHDHKEIVVGSRNEGAENVNHVYYMVNAKDKYLVLKRIVDFYPRIYGIIFCRTKKETQEIADALIRDGYNAESLHGDLSQQQRDLTMQKFRTHVTQLLVATDVAARGLDVNDLTHVINFGMPDDIENYTHRSGRTGRAGKKGTSIAIVHTREKHKIRAVEKVIGKEFVEGDIPSPKDICTKQLYRVMDEIVKVDVNDEEIEPFMAEINRHFEYIDKEDIIKKMVSLEFGKFLAYYADAPVIEKPSAKQQASERKKERQRNERKGSTVAEIGFRKLFINLGKKDGFYPGEVMQFVNRHVDGRQEVGHIDLLDKYAFIEVPEEDAERVAQALDGQRYRGREVRCNDAETGNPLGNSRSASSSSRSASASASRGQSSSSRSAAAKKNPAADGFERYEKKSKQRYEQENPGKKSRRGQRGEMRMESGRKDDWRQFFQGHDIQLVGEEPDFSEEGWARRKPKKKK